MFTILLGCDGSTLLIDIICAVWIFVAILFASWIGAKEKSGGADGSVNVDDVDNSAKEEVDLEVVEQRRRNLLIGALIGVVVVVVACLFFTSYMPRKAFRELEKYQKIADEKGIDKVPESAISEIDNYRNLSIILDKEKREELYRGIRLLRKTIEERELGYERYRQAIDELKEINATQKTAEDMTDESEYPQGVTVDSNEAEVSVPVYDAPLVVTADGQQISSVNGPWVEPAD